MENKTEIEQWHDMAALLEVLKKDAGIENIAISVDAIIALDDEIRELENYVKQGQ